ncbi:hypothetical protein OJF2_63470 [Aquisphaera giovannonii]|uniref:Peptidase A2 domain-containing protein n=1 Tax=Aquisphaera giovannonii TaxID=406548 RepID=A0A5B9WAZ7_9BACT|nr:retropepsin-like aspartic protease [Aquisphaera giovannonii]QEH37756.1 hypothetical protein OJF2_63470 [Aquisphaera giovannonii]
MSPRIVAPSIFLSGACAAAIAADGKPDRAAEPASNPRYQVSAAGSSLVLLDVTSGSTWILGQARDGGKAWLPIPRGDGKEVREVPDSLPAAPFAPPPDLRRFLESQGYKRIPLRRMASGYLTTGAKLNGKELTLVIDTGAPNTHLDRERTRELGLKWMERGDGKAAGSDQGTAVAVVQAIEVGQARSGPIRIGIHSMAETNRAVQPYGDGPVDGVLGADVLDPAWAVIDYRKCELYLRDR